MKFDIIFTETADACYRDVLMGKGFYKYIWLRKKERIHFMRELLNLGENPFIGLDPIYPVLRCQNYKLLQIDDYLVLYKIDTRPRRVVTIYVIVRDIKNTFLNIFLGT